MGVESLRHVGTQLLVEFQEQLCRLFFGVLDAAFCDGLGEFPQVFRNLLDDVGQLLHGLLDLLWLVRVAFNFVNQLLNLRHGRLHLLLHVLRLAQHYGAHDLFLRRRFYLQLLLVAIFMLSPLLLLSNFRLFFRLLLFFLLP